MPDVPPGRWLILEDLDGPRTVRLRPGETVVGRDPTCDVVIRDFGCSRRHAKVVVDAAGARVVDLKSKGGTQVNRKAVVEAALQSGDELLLGKFPIRYQEGPEP